MGVPISNVTRRVVYSASGTGPYAFTFEILAAGDIAVYKDDTLLTLTTDYTVTIAGNGTGSITLTAAPTGATQIAIVGNRTIQRTTDFTTGGDFFANTLNDELDQQTIFAQQNAEGLARALQAPQTDPTNINMTLPRKADRAGKYLAFDANGNPEPGDTSVDIALVAANINNINTVKGQITPTNNIATVAGNDANISTVAGISGNVTTVAGVAANVTTVAGISSNVTSVAGNATNINTVAGISGDVTAVAGIASDVAAVENIAANVTTVAGISGNVTTVAGVAANVTTVAGISSNVTTVAGISSAVTTAATNVADITNFADVYLGPKTSNPTQRNDTTALQSGDLYFNTAAVEMRVYNGSSWQTIATLPDLIVEYEFLATAGQTSYTFTGGYRVGFTYVWVNGAMLADSDITATNGTTITFGTPLSLNDEVRVITFKAVGSVTAADTGAVAKTGDTMTGALTVRAANAIRSEAASTQDAVVIAGRAGGTSSYAVTLTPTTLAANRTITLPDASTTMVGTDTTQTLTNKTLTDPAIIGTILEDVYTISDGAAFEIDPGNGSIQLITLGANRTPKATNFAAGEAMTLMVDDGTAYTLTWTDTTFGTSGVVWKTDSGSAPTLNTTGYTVIVLWKISSQVYGARVGNA